MEVSYVRKFLIGLAVIILLAIPAGFLQMADGIYFSDKFLYMRGENEYRLGNTCLIVDKTNTGAVFSGKVFGEVLNGTMEISDEHDSIHSIDIFPQTDIDGIAAFRFNEYDYVAGIVDDWLIDTDGLPLNIGIISDSLEESQRELANTVWNITQKRPICQGNLINVILGAIIAILGLPGLIWPEQTYFFFTSWKFENPQLSDDGIFAERIGSVILSIIGIVFMYVSIFF